jgi:hypothetical protein
MELPLPVCHVKSVFRIACMWIAWLRLSSIANVETTWKRFHGLIPCAPSQLHVSTVFTPPRTNATISRTSSPTLAARAPPPPTPRPSPYTRTRAAHHVENGSASLNTYGSLAGTFLVVDNLFVYPMTTKKMRRKMGMGMGIMGDRSR